MLGNCRLRTGSRRWAASQRRKAGAGLPVWVGALCQASRRMFSLSGSKGPLAPLLLPSPTLLPSHLWPGARAGPYPWTSCLSRVATEGPPPSLSLCSPPHPFPSPSQARRTGSSSPLGQLFDHGCDALVLHMMLGNIAASLGVPCSWKMAAGCMGVSGVGRGVHEE